MLPACIAVGADTVDKGSPALLQHCQAGFQCRVPMAHQLSQAGLLQLKPAMQQLRQMWATKGCALWQLCT